MLRKIAITVISLILMVGCTVDKETHLIPKGYKGKVFIQFSDPKGQEKQWEDGRRLYIVPNSGRLYTKFRSNTGSFHPGDMQFFYIDQQGNRTEIPYKTFIKSENIDSTKIYVMRLQVGAAELGQGPAIWYYIGKPGEEPR